MTMNNQSTRRGFIASSLVAGSAMTLSGNFSAANAAEEHKKSTAIKPGMTILFQGDSITDAGRKRDQADVPNMKDGMGNGYAWMTAAALLTGPERENMKIFNRGISGNKVHQLAERWQADCLDIKPDLLSILIGVNDIWHALNGKYDGTVETYETDYRGLLTQTTKTLPATKIVICEPFVLRCGAVNEKWFPTFDGFRAAAKKLAADFNAIFVPFQSMFDEAVQYAPPEHWAGDGVHPSPFGASLMACEWLRQVTDAKF